MNAMVLCSACKRHVFAGERACPFCGLAFSSTAHPPAPSVAPDLSRAQRYVVGAAIAATVATAGCSSPTVVHNPNELGNVTVDVNETQSDRSSRESVEVARDPNRDDNALAEEEAARRREEERARQEREEQQRLQLERQREWEERNRWRHRNPCVNGVCPPYGCVFPDEACDIVRV
jgi:hypothetical protein